jgi:hypothetical protein
VYDDNKCDKETRKYDDLNSSDERKAWQMMNHVDDFFFPSTHNQAVHYAFFWSHDLRIDYMPKAGEYYLPRRANKPRNAQTEQGELKR